MWRLIFAGAAALLLMATSTMAAMAQGSGSKPQLEMSNASDLNRAIDDLVVANHILSYHQVLDGYGHISIRHPTRSERFLLARNIAPASVVASDILEFGADGEAIDTAAPKSYLERYIHAAIYAKRPDVMAVIHTHSPSIIPFGVTSTPMRPIYHMSAFLGEGAPVFEIRDQFGDNTDLLITNMEKGYALAHSLADKSVVLMRGHGNTVVGPSLKLAVFRAIYTEKNARLQMDALTLPGGKVNYLTEGEAKAATEVSYQVVDRAWNLWIQECCASSLNSTETRTGSASRKIKP